MPAFAATRLSASGKVRFSCFITKLKISPPSPQPKQCQLSRAGVTTKLGVFSPWNGHSPLRVVHALRSCTASPTTSTIESLLFTSAATPIANPVLLKAELPALPPCQRVEAAERFEDRPEPDSGGPTSRAPKTASWSDRAPTALAPKSPPRC